MKTEEVKLLAIDPGNPIILLLFAGIFTRFLIKEETEDPHHILIKASYPDQVLDDEGPGLSFRRPKGGVLGET
jgi:hypothetical protein